jgi:pSer/pThr/pTyr-binding forkhead associated (FHA) protein
MFKRNPQFIVHLNSESGIPPIPIFEKRFVVGRKPTHLVAIPDNSISRDHLEVIFQDGQIFVMDLGTSNGTAVNGHKIPANIPTPYHQGQILSLGHSTISLSVELFDEDREKRKNNPSAKAIHQLNAKGQSATPHMVASVQPINLTPVPPAPVVQPATQNTNGATAQTASAPSPYSTPAANSPESAYNSVTPQTREDANRIIAKAKIEAEMAVRDLMRNREGEAQKIIQQAEQKALEKLKSADSQVQAIADQAHAEGQKLKDVLIAEAQREKDNILATVTAEKERILRDIDTFKQMIPNLTAQIDQLKLQTQKHQTERVAAESHHTQESIRLEKLLAEVRTQELTLKNIQQQLEINQIKVNDAEAKYNATVVANQTLIDETKAALEMAKARELELNDLIEKALNERESAIDFAKAHRADAESYSIVMREDADSYAKATREETDRWASTIREETDHWAATTKEATELEIRQKIELLQQESATILSERDRTYQEMKERQETILDELKNTESLKLKNLQDIDDILKRKAEDFETAFRTRREGLETEHQTRREQIEREFFEKRETLERELSDRRTSIERELLERRESLERESAEKKASIERDAHELRSLRDKEYKELKTQQDAYLIDVKKREEDRLKALVEESRKTIKEQFHIKNENVQKTFDEFFTDYIKLAPMSMREQLPNLHNQLTKLLKDALTNELTGEDKHLRQLLEYDPAIQKKHQRFWIVFTGVAVFVLAITSYILNNLKQLSDGAQNISTSVQELDQENKKTQAAMLEKIKQAAIYRPDQDAQFKDTYADNVLRTTRYLEFEKDDQYRSQWIVAIKEFLIQEAKLLDDKADELISKEGTLVLSLEREISSIDGRNPQNGIDRMREIENKYTLLLTAILDNEKRQTLKEKKQAFYERYINDPGKARGPAQSH